MIGSAARPLPVCVYGRIMYVYHKSPTRGPFMAERRSPHMTITVPADVRRRMSAVKEDVNWSALACRAFEDKLAEIAARKESKVMNDVVERLRASLRAKQGVSFNDGYEHGRKWAENVATAAELTRLQTFQERTRAKAQLYWEREFWSEYQNPRWIALVGEIQDDKNLRPGMAQAFWESLLGQVSQKPSDGDFLRGFVEGAVDLWAKVQKQL
jgi:hypothetical protein